MKNIFAIVISTLALTAFAADAPGPKKAWKEGQTEADGCHVVKKAEKKPVEKKADAKPAKSAPAEPEKTVEAGDSKVVSIDACRKKT